MAQEENGLIEKLFTGLLRYPNDDLDTFSEFENEIGKRIDKMTEVLDLFDCSIGESVIDIWEMFYKRVSETYATYCFLNTKVKGYKSDNDFLDSLKAEILEVLMSIIDRKTYNVDDFKTLKAKLDALRVKYTEMIRNYRDLDKAYGYKTIYNLLMKGYSGYKSILKRAQTTGENPGNRDNNGDSIYDYFNEFPTDPGEIGFEP